jgi:PleD family two-component response regulator
LLIIEDSPVQSKIIRQRFASLTPFPLLAAHSLAETSEVLEKQGNEIFAAVIDHNLPDAPDGEAVNLCLEKGVTSVVLTATIDPDLRQTFLHKKVADYFLKGSIEDLEPLVACVSRLSANRSVKALIVDDSATQRAIVKKMLAVQCLDALEAKDGQDALDKLARNPDIRLVITDFDMPRVNGIELVQKIRAERSFVKTAVIGLSSAGSGALTAQFLKNGANDFLTKPFEAEELYWRVNQTLSVMDMMRELNALRKN